jgi:head-tail adaptor
MDAGLRDRLSARFVARLCPDTIEVHRFTMTEDGRGGQTLTWRKIGTHKGRMTAGIGNETMPAGGIEAVSKWALLLPLTADIQPRDRVYKPGDNDRYWEVTGSDAGTTDLLIQHIDLEERAQ